MGVIKMTVNTPRDQEIFAGIIAALGREGLKVDVRVRVYEAEIEIMEDK